MEKFYKVYIFLFSLCILSFCSSCKQNLVAPKSHAGRLDLSNYIAIGDGYGAGFTNTDIFNPASNRGLYSMGQLNSFPQLLSNQFSQTTQRVDFEPGLMEGNGSGYFQLERVLVPICANNDLKPVLFEVEGHSSWNIPTETKVNNLSIPHIHLSKVADTELANPFLQRLKVDSIQSYLDIIEASHPSFFTLYIGTRDVLDYALRGAANPDFPLLSKKRFALNYSKILQSIYLSQPVDSRGVVGKLPDLTNFPYFTTISPVWKDQYTCNTDGYPIYIETKTGAVRMARDTDRILLPASYLLGEDMGQGHRYGLSSTIPVPDNLVLDSEEVGQLKERLTSYNNSIDSLVTEYNNTFAEDRIAIAKIDVLVNGLSSGLLEDGIDINNTYLSGGFFGLDGIYLTPRGNAMFANEFVKAINENNDFGALISPLNLINYSGVVFP